MATLTHERMLELLRTSVNIRVLVIPPLLEDGSPRRGCEDPYCSAVLGEDWPLASSGSFSSSRTLFDAPSNPMTAAKRPSVSIPPDETGNQAAAGNRPAGQSQGFETMSRRSLNAAAVGQHQAIMRLQAGAAMQGVEQNDYGYESGPANGFSSKSLDDIQHK